jgi:hypothetical protein
MNMVETKLKKDVLSDLLRSSIITVSFTKLNGEERVMNCTLQPSLLPDSEREKTTAKTKNDQVINVWDTDLDAWRSFRIDSVISANIKGVDLFMSPDGVHFEQFSAES